ncbi:hypothetical protein Tco_0049684 [Tanacetum coccineum]
MEYDPFEEDVFRGLLKSLGHVEGITYGDQCSKLLSRLEMDIDQKMEIERNRLHEVLETNCPNLEELAVDLSFLETDYIFINQGKSVINMEGSYIVWPIFFPLDDSSDSKYHVTIVLVHQFEKNYR